MIKNYVEKESLVLVDEIVFPALTDLQKIKLEKPYYYLNVDGERLHLENVKFLKQQSLFQEACMEQLDFKPPTVKGPDWDMIINPLMKNHEPVEPTRRCNNSGSIKKSFRRILFKQTHWNSYHGS